MISADVKAAVKQEITGLVPVYLVTFYKKYLENLKYNRTGFYFSFWLVFHSA